LVVDGYFFKFFFWIDFVSTVTIIADIGWIWKLIDTEADDTDATDFTGIIKASKAAKIIKVIRIIRVIRIVRMYR
jgi:2-keto-3-deoxy-L-rhamnonate aldolase RhmA